MSAYNRKVLMKMRSGSDRLCDMDESGYASFRALHNSTVEAPFLCEETENCLNASNITTTTFGLHKETESTTLNSMQFQTPSSTYDLNPNSNVVNMTQWRNHRSLSLPTTTTSMAIATSCGLELEDDEMCCKSPLPLSVTMPPGANKRRKPHTQSHMAHHSSPKKSKKKLFPQATIDPICRTRYYNGIEQLDIVGMLIHNVPALECILSKLSSSTLDTMTKVSQLWAQAVYKSERALERLENHRFKMTLTKENSQHSVKGERKLSRSVTNWNIVPLQPSNAIHKPNNKHDFNFNRNRNTPIEDSCLLVEQSQRIKCPRCGKSSKVFYNQSIIDQTPQPSRYPRTTASLSQTLPHSYSMSQECKPPLTRFFSLDEVKSSSPDENESSKYAFGECTSTLCKFRFCVHCCCAPHPGEKCLVTEMGTPSKVMMPGEKWTPPKPTQKYDSKLSRKKSLKRLNF
ncbi:hypothetical protein KR215_009852 [Drosophila sulfurigaster]|nr:hypothetical protein KR215_009852 [Drosophila sulfurigaster]